MKIKVDSKKVRENIIKRFNQFVDSPTELKKFGDRLVKNIKADATLGQNYKGDGLPSLSSEWIQRKAKLLEKNSPSRFYSYGKSNLSFMGDLLKGISYKVLGSVIVLIVSGKHKKVKGIRGEYLKGSDANLSDVYDGLINLNEGYKILGVSDKSKIFLRKLFIQFLRRKK